MGKNGIHTYKQHVVKMLDRRLGAKEPLECTKEVSDVLMCWGTVFVSSTSQYDPAKCKVRQMDHWAARMAIRSG